MTAKLFPLGTQLAIVTVDPRAGARAADLGERPRRQLLKQGFLDLDDDRVVLTPAGAAVRDLVVELHETKAQIQRMVETGLQLGISRATPAEMPRRPKPPAELTCGRYNHDSFATFIVSLNGAGKNRWQDPGFTGEAPVRAVPPPAHKDEDHGRP